MVDVREVGLQFTVPFLSIPLNSLLSTTSAGMSNIFNMNFETILIIGGIALAAIVLIPLVLSNLGINGGLGFGNGINQFMSQFGIPNVGNVLFGRSSDQGEEEVPGLLARIDEALEENHINVTSCAQRFVCNYVSDANQAVKRGDADSLDYIINGVAKNSYINRWLKDTEIDKAVEYGKYGGHCNRVFPEKRCPFTKQKLYRGLAEFVASDI